MFHPHTSTDSSEGVLLLLISCIGLLDMFLDARVASSPAGRSRKVPVGQPFRPSLGLGVAQGHDADEGA